jgi:cyclophilin family peptidyl-prolyl cis-trans isomerase
MKWLSSAACALLLVFSAQAADLRVEMKTSAGDIVVELYPEKAPATVENFLAYAKDGFYTGTIFHRVIDGFMIQGGGFTEQYTQKSTRSPVQNEAANGLKNRTGTLAMARTQQPHSATAQFFINVSDNDFLDHTAPTLRGYGYTVFGKVVKGMDVVNAIARMPTGPGGPFPKDAPLTPVVIQQVTVIGEAK